MFKRIQDLNATYKVKMKNLLAYSECDVCGTDVIDGSIFAEITSTKNLDVLIKACLSVSIESKHTLYLRKGSLVAYEPSKVLLQSKKLIISDEVIEIMEIKILEDTEILLSDVETLTVQMQGVGVFEHVIGWLDNLPCFRIKALENERFIFLEWKTDTTVVFQA